MKKIKKGDIYLADMDPAIGSEQGGVRPVLVIQNNKGNKYSPTTIVACLTSRVHTKASLPAHYLLPDDIGLKYPSMVMLEQIFTSISRNFQKLRLQFFQEVSSIIGAIQP